MTQIAINADDLSKLYRLGAKTEFEDSLVRSVFNAARNPIGNYKKYRSLYRFDDVDINAGPQHERNDILWALHRVSFEVRTGEVVGIIGRNGAGKSTLLKILSRITLPTRGKVSIFGRVASLLEVGTGFHNELTGRENVYLNGTILGMRKKEVDRKFDEIVDFSGVEKFLDTPVKRYSSGMRVRLAFAVAAHLEPEILIIDEVLAVGDAAFQEKCLKKMEHVGGEGRTVFFVSHNMAAVSRLCKRVIMLDRGQLVDDGKASDIVARYLHEGAGSTSERVWSDPASAPGGDIVRLSRVRIKNRDDATVDSIDIDQSVGFEMEFRVLEEGHTLLPHFQVVNDEGVVVFLTLDIDPEWRKRVRPRGVYTVTAWVPPNLLSEGSFFLMTQMRVMSPQNFEEFSESEAVSFQVADPMIPGKLTARGDWVRDIPGVVRPLLQWETRYREDQSA